jgi:tRNA (mo5U34)-methyltransferase
LRGKTVLDIGCNAGFYSFEMKRRGAHRVLGIDSEEGYLDQARFTAAVNGLDVEFRNLSVYEVAGLRERFDLVLFLGVLYHLRYPLLALDVIHEHAAKDLLVFQSLLRGSPRVERRRRYSSPAEIVPGVSRRKRSSCGRGALDEAPTWLKP